MASNSFTLQKTGTATAQWFNQLSNAQKKHADRGDDLSAAQGKKDRALSAIEVVQEILPLYKELSDANPTGGVRANNLQFYKNILQEQGCAMTVLSAVDLTQKNKLDLSPINPDQINQLSFREQLAAEYYNQALGYINSKLWDRANECLKRSILLNPNNVSARLASAYVVSKPEKAQLGLDQLSQLKDKVSGANLAHLNYVMGMIYWENNSSILATSAFLDAIAADPSYVPAYLSQAEVAVSQTDVRSRGANYQDPLVTIKSYLDQNSQGANLSVDERAQLFGLQADIFKSQGNTNAWLEALLNSGDFDKIRSSIVTEQDTDTRNSLIKVYNQLSSEESRRRAATTQTSAGLLKAFANLGSGVHVPWSEDNLRPQVPSSGGGLFGSK